MIPKLILFGPISPPYTGQSIAFTTFANSFDKEDVIVIDTQVFKSRAISSFYAIIKVFLSFLFNSIDKVYFTSSRSKLGFIKDLALITCCRFYDCKVINHLHGSDFLDFYNSSGLLKQLIRNAYNYIDTSIVLLDEMKEEYQCFKEMRIEVVNNFYSASFDYFNGFPNKLNQILYFSNIMYSKGILDFLDSCKMFLSTKSEYKVAIAGKAMGDSFMGARAIEKLFSSKISYLANLFPGRISYYGSVYGEEKARLFFESSVFILPTFYPTEAVPLTIIEAMRAGNAIITTDHNYLKFFVSNDNGRLVPTRNPKAIYVALLNLIDETDIKIIMKHNMSLAQNSYSESLYINKLQKILK